MVIKVELDTPTSALTSQQPSMKRFHFILSFQFRSVVLGWKLLEAKCFRKIHFIHLMKQEKKRTKLSEKLPK